MANTPQARKRIRRNNRRDTAIRPAPTQCQRGLWLSPLHQHHGATEGLMRIATGSVTITPPATSSRASAR